MTAKPSQEMLDRQADFLELHIKEHLPALAKKRYELIQLEKIRTGRAPKLEVLVPMAWDILGLGKVGEVFQVPAYAGYVPKPIMRASISDRRVTEREEMLEERLEQRTAALNRTVDQNTAMRDALLRVLEKADVRFGLVSATEVHDAIGSDLIGWLTGPPVVPAEKPVSPITRMSMRDLIDRQVAAMFIKQPRIPNVFGGTDA